MLLPFAVMALLAAAVLVLSFGGVGLSTRLLSVDRVVARTLSLSRTRSLSFARALSLSLFRMLAR